MELYLTKYKWYNSDNVWVTGFIRKGDSYLSGNEFLECFKDINSIDIFRKILNNLNGQFAIVLKRSDSIWAATDRLRNIPIFYSWINDNTVISDDCYQLAELQDSAEIDETVFDCFMSSGFALNNSTLVFNVFQVEAGEYVILNESATRKFYYDRADCKAVENDFKTVADRMASVLSDVFKSHFNALRDDFIAISLSGGYDSRLIAAMCSKFHPQNVICYTYGIKDNAEEKLARKVAERLGIKWIKIDYDSKLTAGYINEDIFKMYFQYASDLSSMFFMEQFFAVRYLKENNLVPDNCVFITGFSGDMLAGSHLYPALGKMMDKGKIADIIFRNFCELNRLRHSKKGVITEFIKEKIPTGKSKACLTFESWDQKERQAKFIVNSAKVFSYFGYRYVLPLWDNDISDFFSSLQLKYKINKRLYDYVLKEEIFKDKNLNFHDEINPSSSQKMVQRIKERIKKLLPDKILNLYVNHQSIIFYDGITKDMLEDMGNGLIGNPGQTNFYNAYIIQWYLIKTREKLENISRKP